MIDEIEKIYFVGNTETPMSYEHQTYIQCTEMYHCTPSELEAQDEQLITDHWTIRNQINVIQNRKSKKKSGVRTIDVSGNNFGAIDTEKL